MAGMAADDRTSQDAAVIGDDLVEALVDLGVAHDTQERRKAGPAAIGDLGISPVLLASRR